MTAPRFEAFLNEVFQLDADAADKKGTAPADDRAPKHIGACVHAPDTSGKLDQGLWGLMWGRDNPHTQTNIKIQKLIRKMWRRDRDSNPGNP